MERVVPMIGMQLTVLSATNLLWIWICLLLALLLVALVCTLAMVFAFKHTKMARMEIEDLHNRFMATDFKEYATLRKVATTTAEDDLKAMKVENELATSAAKLAGNEGATVRIS